MEQKKKIKSQSAALLHIFLQFSLIAFCLFRVFLAPVWDCCETSPAPLPISPEKGLFCGVKVAPSHLELWTIRASALVVSILTPSAHVPYRSSCLVFFLHHFYHGGDAVPPILQSDRASEFGGSFLHTAFTVALILLIGSSMEITLGWSDHRDPVD